jgi:hypothetical protein
LVILAYDIPFPSDLSDEIQRFFGNADLGSGEITQGAILHEVQKSPSLHEEVINAFSLLNKLFLLIYS